MIHWNIEHSLNLPFSSLGVGESAGTVKKEKKKKKDELKRHFGKWTWNFSLK